MRFLLILLSLLLTACATTVQTPIYLYQVPRGTVLSLERPLTFKAGTTSVYLQDGKLFSQMAIVWNYGGVNRYLPYCALELRRKVGQTQTLSPRKFVITGVKWDSTFENMFDLSMFRTQWRLSGGGEPQALTFTCYRMGTASHDSPIRLDEVDGIVGDYFRLMPAKEAAQGATDAKPRQTTNH